MKKFLLSVMMMFTAFVAVNAAEAEASAELRSGVIRGRVLDTEKHVLAGALVFIEALEVAAISDANGYYVMTGVKPGSHKLEVSYLGYAPSEATVSSVLGKTTRHDITLKEGVEIDAVTVTGVMQGQHRAINSQKNSLNLVDIVSSEQAGKYPDSNIGDALKRISGINVQYDQGEARFGQVRGTPADMSSVTLNGNRVPSAEGDTRAVQLDLIPSDMIQTIEVNKVVTPDMDADAIGGSINLITKNSPSKQVISATVGTGYNVISEKPVYNAAATYGNTFLNGKLGFIASASYQNNTMGSDNAEYVWTEEGQIEEMNIRQYYVQRQRQSYSASLNYQINDNHKLDFKGMFNRRHDWENRYRFVIEGMEDGEAEYVELQTKGGSKDNKYTRLELQTTMDFTLGGEHMFKNLEMDWSVSYAQASELRPDERYAQFEYDGEDTPWNFNVDYKTNTPSVDATSISVEDMELAELSESQQTIKETDLKAKIDFKLPIMKGEYGSDLKFGAKYVSKTKDKEVYAYELDGDDYYDDALLNLKDQNRAGFMVGDNYKFGKVVTREWLGNVDFTKGETEYIPKESAENYEAKEDVTSGYIRYDQKLGSKMELMVGARVENTAVTYSGYQVAKKQDMESLDDLQKIEGEGKNYTNILPSLLFKWQATDRLKLRAAFTNTVARPKYADLAPNIYINKDEVEVGNSDLIATTSYNFDLFADYYFNSLGLVRVGLFAKQINDFIVDYTYEDTDTYLALADEAYGKDYGKVEVTQAQNAGNAILAGAEISLSRDFGFIAPALNCLGFSGTYTYTYSKVTDFQLDRETSDLSLPGSPEHTANVSLYFEKKGFTARLSYNFASAFLDEYGSKEYKDVYYDKVNYMDLNLGYTFGKNKNFNVYADVTNLLNQPLRYYQGGNADQTYQVEYYGVRCNLGFKMNF